MPTVSCSFLVGYVSYGLDRMFCWSFSMRSHALLLAVYATMSI